VIVLSGLTARAGQPMGAGGAAEAEAPAGQAAEPSNLPTSGGARPGNVWWIAVVVAASLALVTGGMLLSRARSQAGESH
jgi:hypothetical protein